MVECWVFNFVGWHDSHWMVVGASDNEAIPNSVT